MDKRIENGLIFGPKVNRFMVMERGPGDFDWKHAANCATYQQAQEWIEAQGQSVGHMFRIDKVWMAE